MTVEEGNESVLMHFDCIFGFKTKFIFVYSEGVVQEGDVMYSICSYMAETNEAINLVEGEKVYIIGKHFNLPSISTYINLKNIFWNTYFLLYYCRTH